jgi:hypothetical protein
VEAGPELAEQAAMTKSHTAAATMWDTLARASISLSSRRGHKYAPCGHIRAGQAGVEWALLRIANTASQLIEGRS